MWADRAPREHSHQEEVTMLLRTWRFAAITLTALLMGLEFGHALELPAKMGYDGPLYVRTQNTLYQFFGWPGPGAWVTLGAVLSAVGLAFLVRERRPAFPLTLVAAACLLLAFPVVYFWFIEPVNVVIEQATPTSVPANWEQLRRQWEYAHAANFVLDLVALGALLLSVLAETPAESPAGTGVERPRERVVA
jgi:hypothetical protein